MIIFEKEYDDESLRYLQEDVYDQVIKCIDDSTLEQDEIGFVLGKYIVQVVWKDER